MDQQGFKVNPELQRTWQAAMGEMLSIASPKDQEGVHRLITLSARRFTKNIVEITPPAHEGVSGTAAKQAGQEAILRDLLKIAIPTVHSGSRRQAREVLASAEELLAAHGAQRVGGTVDGRRSRDKLFTSWSEFNKVLRVLQSRVGWLAAAMNTAADRLGIALPAWIKRHGTKYGHIEVHPNKYGLRVRIIQNVPFADDVKGYPRRWNFALTKEISSLQNQVKAIWERKTARAKARLAKR